MEVVGPNLTLRYATPDDAERMFSLASDPEVTRFFAWDYRRQRDAEAWIAGLTGRRERGELLELAVELRGEGIVGATGLSELARRDRRATVGTWLGRAHWGQGINEESKALVAALAFGPLGIERLTAYASTGNTRSQRALERLGFLREGVLRSYHRHPGHVHDVVVYGMLRGDYRASPLSSVHAELHGALPPSFVVG
jgi:ribosomal-protein-alanine N-acetyltransferase